jgi:hypothetical protein
MEFWACAKIIEKESGSVSIEEMIRSIAKLMGFKRAGPDFQLRAKSAMETMK